MTGIITTYFDKYEKYMQREKACSSSTNIIHTSLPKHLRMDKEDENGYTMLTHYLNNISQITGTHNKAILAKLVQHINQSVQLLDNGANLFQVPPRILIKAIASLAQFSKDLFGVCRCWYLLGRLIEEKNRSFEAGISCYVKAVHTRDLTACVRLIEGSQNNNLLELIDMNTAISLAFLLHENSDSHYEHIKEQKIIEKIEPEELTAKNHLCLARLIEKNYSDIPKDVLSLRALRQACKGYYKAMRNAEENLMSTAKKAIKYYLNSYKEIILNRTDPADHLDPSLSDSDFDSCLQLAKNANDNKECSEWYYVLSMLPGSLKFAYAQHTTIANQFLAYVKKNQHTLPLDESVFKLFDFSETKEMKIELKQPTP